jgi:hypothetical protein
MNYCFKLLVLAVCLHLLAAGQAFCGAPLKINFQGRLDENGQPAAGSKTFVFKIYDAVSGGSLVWTSAAQPLTLSDGVFSALLAAGDTTALSTATFAAARFVELSVDGVTLAPRQEMVSAPYALVAQALAADADIPPTAIAAGSVTDAKVLLTTAAITSGLFGDDRVNLSTGAITAGVFSDERIRISTGAFYADFNGPYQLVQLNNVGRFPATFVGDGALSANVLVSSVAVGKIYGGAIQDNAVTDEKVLLSTAAITYGRFGDWRVRITTGAVALGRFSDDRVLITTGAFVSDEQLEAAAFNAPDQLVRLSAAGALPAADGSLLWNLPVPSGAVARTGDRMTGQLTLAGSTLTVTGNAFSVGETAFTVESGLVGIGTASPVEKLTVMDGNISAIQNTGAAMISVRTYDAAGYARLFLGHAGNKIWDIGHYGADRNNNFELQHYTGAAWLTNRLVVTPDGNVGISTGMPQGRLDVLAAGLAPADLAQIWRNSAGAVVSSVSATGVHMAFKFIGDGSQLDNLPVPAGAVAKTGAIMTGQLTLYNSTLTVAGSAFSVGVTTLTVENGLVGVGTQAPNSRLTVAGPVSLAVRTVAASYTIAADDSTILVDASGGPVNVTMPSAAGVTGRVYTIKVVNMDNTVTIYPHDPGAPETVDGSSGPFIFGANWDFVVLQSDGTQWLEIGGTLPPGPM